MLISLILILSSCSSAVNPDYNPESENIKVGVIFPTSIMNFILDKSIEDWNWTQKRLEKHLMEVGFQSKNLIFRSAVNYREQKRRLDEMIAQGVDTIIISGIAQNEPMSLLGVPITFIDDWNKMGDTIDDQLEVLQTLKLARALGIKLVGWGDNLLGTTYDLRVTIPGAFDLGKFQAEYLLDSLDLSSSNTDLSANSSHSPGKDYDFSMTDEVGSLKDTGHVIDDDTDSSLTMMNNPAPKYIEVLANYKPYKRTYDYLQGVCEVLIPYYLSGQIASKQFDCFNFQNLFDEKIDQTDLLNFSDSIKRALEVYLPTTFSSATYSLTSVICTSDNIAQEVIEAHANASLIPQVNLAYPVIVGVGGFRIGVQNMLDGKQNMTVIYDNDILTERVAHSLVSLVKHNNLETDTIRANFIPITLTNLKEELIDTGYLSAGEAGL
jgi:ABC-type xylose transport system substrate-binding protein